MLEIAKTQKACFRFTANQHVIISDVAASDKAAINQILEQYNVIKHTNSASQIRKSAMACVALPTCPLALAESQRYLPSLISKIERILNKHGLEKENIILRMTGCPNGCARPYIAEIGLVGTALGKYNLHIGGDNQGLRLNKLYKENLEEAAILTELDHLFQEFKNERKEKESFGDFVMRKELVAG